MKMVRVRFVMLLLMIPVFAGCSLMKTKPEPTGPSYDQLMQQAAARYKAQDIDGAKVLYSKAADAAPTRGEPWYRLAEINFDQQNYGHAIVDAQEVLRRDRTDTNAESILTVAGLRVAVQALGRLHDESDQQGPAHAEAEKLAAKMRETLGQEVLVPPEAKPARHRTRRRRSARKAAPVVAPKPAPAKAEPASNNPFQGLPGGL